MLKIGEFSVLSHITVKALRYYEKEGILLPSETDAQTGYRFYDTGKLETAAEIRRYRQMDLSIDEIRAILSGGDEKEILAAKARALEGERNRLDGCLLAIRQILEEEKMKYEVTEKRIPEMTVYTSETVLPRYSDAMQWIPSVGEECLRLNPGIRCAEPPYEFMEYLDGEYRETDVRVRHTEAVTSFGAENERIRFGTLPPARVLSILHKGPYENIGEAYAFIMKYAEVNGYKVAGLARECYIDGIWNKETPEEWLTEIQLPVEG